ncbi:hypothetical protein ILYODFUR_024073 [Ilyodon furcidens]|uniref:Uncharacterized protein n=1 Tax=Ilyodon furcidens TaxID=33524 RepID=A0ABV0UIP6_9TELE
MPSKPWQKVGTDLFHLDSKDHLLVIISPTTLKSLHEKNVKRIEDANSWNRKAIVLEEVGPRSFKVMTGDGQVIGRNRRSLLKARESFEERVTERKRQTSENANQSEMESI